MCVGGGAGGRNEELQHTPNAFFVVEDSQGKKKEEKLNNAEHRRGFLDVSLHTNREMLQE